jgi:hypothetical protein
MRPSNLVASAGALRKAVKLLRQRFDGTEAQWNDDVRRSFEEEHLVEIERGLRQIIERMGRLAQVLQKAERECS